MAAPRDDQVRILLLEDSDLQATLVKQQLKQALSIDYSLVHVESLAPALEHLASEPVSFVLCDLNVPDSSGLDTFRSVRKAAPHIPIIVHSSEGDEEMAVTAVREGAEDYLVKNRYDSMQMARCIRFAVERSRRIHIEKEVSCAASVQHGLYPDSGPVIPGFDIAGEAFSARQTGGDYFDFIPMTETSIGIVVGDVSGHGLGPAMRMAETRAYLRALTDIWAHLRALAKSHVDPGDILSHLNRLMIADGKDGFMSMFFGCIDTQSKSLVYASAGHPGHLIKPTSKAYTMTGTGPPLGAVAEAIISSYPRITLEADDLIVLSTDGIYETENRNGEQFRVDRMLNVAHANRDCSAHEIVKAIYEATRDFAEGTPQRDDITAVVVKVSE